MLDKDSHLIDCALLHSTAFNYLRCDNAAKTSIVSPRIASIIISFKHLECFQGIIRLQLVDSC